MDKPHQRRMEKAVLQATDNTLIDGVHARGSPYDDKGYGKEWGSKGGDWGKGYGKDEWGKGYGKDDWGKGKDAWGGKPYYDDTSYSMQSGGLAQIRGMPPSTNLNGTQVTLKEFDHRKNAWICVFPSGKERVVGVNNLAPVASARNQSSGWGDDGWGKGGKGYYDES